MNRIKKEQKIRTEKGKFYFSNETGKLSFNMCFSYGKRRGHVFVWFNFEIENLYEFRLINQSS